tara:strand:- start:65 stop:829 length:765 start_codon:yes stop_codon:yes gene_type:complete
MNYYVYHIIGKKVGCTTNLIRRVEQQQGIFRNNYEVLAITKDIDAASNLEIYHQSRLGYAKDQTLYNKLITKSKLNMNNSKNYSDSGTTITFYNTNNQTMSRFVFPSKLLLLDGTIINLTSEVVAYIKKTNTQSQFNDTRYVYTQNLINYVERNKEFSKSIYDNIRDWAKDKGIYEKGDGKTQYIKLMEEAGELAQALLKEDEPEIIDAIGDIVIVLTNLAYLRGHNIEDCVSLAYNVIKNRTGKMENGTFKKN